MIHYRHLTREKRYMLFELLQAGKSHRECAIAVGVSHSTISRELRRNHNAEFGYRYDWADNQYQARRKKSRQEYVLTDGLKQDVIKHLECKWSPEQISGRLRRETRGSISHQTIYNWLARDRQAGGELYKLLRRKRRYSRHKTRETHIKARRMIDERPAIVESRERLGDWELDTVASVTGDTTVVVTAEERRSRLLVASMLPSRNAGRIARRICRMMNSTHVPPLTLTSDNGTEFAGHQIVAKKIKTDFFFAQPHHPWERGTNENTNGLLRQYLPSGIALKGKAKRLSAAVKELNARPRKCLAFATPEEVFVQEMKKINSGALEI